MKIINISYDDHANLAFNNANALRSVGIYCTSCKRRSHPFDYAEEDLVVSENAMLDLCADADVIQLFHSYNPPFVRSMKDKKFVVWHTGTAYRLNPESCNEIFNPWVNLTITDQCEFMHLGAKNIHYMATAIDTDKIKPLEKEIKKPYLIGHYPSNPTVKGTDKIREMIAELAKEFPYDFIFDCDETILPHERNLERIAKCDIYIEMFAPTQHGKEYGCFGVTAFEAAAMGVVCITQNSYPKVYEDAYWKYKPFIIANDEKEFYNLLKDYLLNDVNFLINDKAAVRRNLVSNHSLQATGERMKKLLEI